ncbi:hypothetical protein [Natrialba sp. INN-245]|uniref:hypothetical protein n=1 Tax=Natrialba sp. INN-245 TaxID=2690967 RepID=UPI001F179E39|nr:hypothetical protein [Natrialba sp. INN-245]
MFDRPALCFPPLEDDRRTLREHLPLLCELALVCLPVIDVEVDANGPDRFAIFVAFGYFSDISNPLPVAVGGPHPVFRVVQIRFACDMFVQRLLDGIKVVGMDALFPLLEMWFNLVEGMSEHPSPLFVELDLVGSHVPVPDPEVRALDSKFEPFFKTSNLSFPLFLLGDVCRDATKSHDLSVFGIHW